MKVLVVIPARYASTRFPGKPLALLGGETIVSRVYHRVKAVESVSDVYVATDDQRIFDHVISFGGKDAAMMTASTHHSGTDRCGEVLQKLEAQGRNYDVVINVQGDEPFIDPEQVEILAKSFEDPSVQIATLVTHFPSTDDLLSPNNAKVVVSEQGKALYFSRQPIPFRRGVPVERWLEEGKYYKHVGIYAFRSDVLHKVCALKPAPLEESEKLEQLRWLSAGYQISVVETNHSNIGIDTPEDLAEAESQLQAAKSNL